MSGLFALGDAIGVAIVILGGAVVVMELYGKSPFLTRPFIRPNGFRWTAAGVATAGVTAAVLIATLTIGANIVIVPGFISLNPSRGLEPVIGLLFGIPGLVGGLIANPVYDVFTGKLSLGSIAGAITIALSAYVYYRLFSRNPSLKGFARPQVWGRYVWGVILATLVVKGIGIAGWLGALHLLPETVVWYVTFPALFLSQGAAHLIIGPILTKILYPFVDRFGLTAEHPTADATLSPPSDFANR
jgi:energy-coupling factor transport system substrate-specific component